MYSIKREIYLNKEQKELYFKTKNVCRFLYNKMISINQSIYKESGLFIDSYSFSKFVNNHLRKGILAYKYEFLGEVPKDSKQKALRNCEIAFKDFFSKKKGFPKFKSKKNDNTGVYLCKNNKTDFTKVYRNKIKIPSFGFVYLKQFGKLDLSKVKSCTITDKNDRFYISFLIDDENKIPFEKATNTSIGIDLGIKDFAVLSNNKSFKGISKIQKIKKLERRRKRLQRKSSRQYRLNNKSRSKNYVKTQKKINLTYERSKNVINGYFNKILNTLAIAKPYRVVVEDLNVRGMVKNKKLSKKIQESSFRAFLTKLKNFCNKRDIEFVKADRFYPSTQTCSNCGNVLQGKNKLTLADRIYHCKECGLEIDRDLNASINLSKYKENTDKLI